MQTLKSLRCGALFQLRPDGAVFVRCRGGYRYGRGGPLLPLVNAYVVRYAP